MSSERWERIQTLFEQALEQPDEVRDAFIESACGSDVALRDEVVSLLAIRLRPSNRQPGGEDDQVQELPANWLRALTTASSARFTTGQRIAGRYLVQRLLGSGGMGEVCEVWDEELAIPVALKTLRVIGTEGALQRLKRESLLARSVSHPNVCRVYDVGRHGEDGATVWFLTMELLRGETIAERLRRERTIPPDRALGYARQMAAGLDAAHQAGVVHRDFKTENVMLVGEGAAEQAVVMDFGISRATSPSEVLTLGAEIRGTAHLGTPAYMAPEQVLGETVGPLADIYALGVVLYEMVTGALPFTGRSAIEVARRRLKEQPPSPRSIVPELDEHWESAILRCLSREPSQRFGRAEAVIRALEGQEVRAAGQDVAAVARHTLPAERDVFVGRESELEELGRQLAGPAPIITLMGAAGMGKTRLAVRYGWRSLGDWPGGVWFCDLTEAQDLNGMASAVARRLGIHFGREDPIVQIGQAIAGRGRCLVILDNFEQIASHAAVTVGRWTVRAKEARFLVTSRERLGLDKEERVQQVEPLSPEQGLELFEARARWLRPGIELVGREADSAREIVRLVDGMPLAIELAATRMRVMSADQIATQMRRRFQLLTGGPGTRHATLEAAIDGSWEMMREWERGAWTQCSVFEGGFTLEAAEAVIHLETWPEAPWVVDVIQSLVDKSLLRTWVTGVEPGGGVPEVRLGMYVSLQDYARMKLREAGGDAAVEKRHGEWYGQFGSQEALQLLNRDEGVARWRKLERELDNLMAVCRRALRRGDGPTFVVANEAVWRVLESRGPFAPVIEMGQEALDFGLGRTESVSILNILGLAESYSGRMQARDHLEAALVLARELGDRRMERRALVSLGIMYVLKGQTEEALTYLEMGLAHARADGDQDIEGYALNNLGNTCRDLGRMEEARAYLELALTLCRTLGNRRHEGTVLGNLGLLDQDLGHVEQARARYEAALAIHREVGNRRFEGNILCNLGSLDVDQDPETARHYLNAALAIHRAMGDRRGESIALSNLGALPVAKEQLDDVRAYYEAALAIHRELGNRRFEGAVLMNLADVLHEQNRTEEAWNALKQAEDTLRQLNAPVEICQVLCLRAELEHESGNMATARDTLGEIEALAKQIESGPDSPLGQMVAKVHHTLAKDPKDVQART